MSVCAAAARKAAEQGLAHPGFPRVPDLHGGSYPRPPIGALPPSHNGFWSKATAAERHKNSYGPSGARATSPDGRMYQQTRPGRSESTFALNQGERLSLPRGQFVIKRRPTFAQVKRIGPPSDAQAWSRSALASRVFQGRGSPLSIFYGRRNLALDKPGPNGRGVSLNRLRPPPSWGHRAVQRVLTGYGRLQERAKAFASRRMNQDLTLVKLGRIKFPDPKSKAFFQSNNLTRPMTKPKIRAG